MSLFRFAIVTAVAVLLAAPPAKTGDVGPYLRLVQRSERLRQAWKPQRMTPAGLLRQVERPASVGALVRTGDVARTAAAVREMGGYAGRAVGSILPVRASVEVLARVAERPEVERVEAGPPRRPLLDLSRPEVRADEVEAGDGLLMSIDGTGAIAALVDTGIDYEHPDFAGPTGRTRVQAIWDQVFASGEPPPGQTVGAYCDRDSLLRGNCNSLDFIGHGTHVAATMAGSGETYRGMAPGADVMGVASIDFGLLVESVAWLFDQAEARSMPMVVNLSLGGHYGPHDGTGLESQALSELVGPGRIIMASAGNEGSDVIHLGYDPQGSTGKTLFSVFSGFDVSAALFTIWLEPGAELSFAVGVADDAGEKAETDFVPGDGSYRSFALSDEGVLLGRVQIQPAGFANPDNGKHQVDILIEPEDAAFQGNPGGYVWYIKARGTGAFDAWSAASGFLTPPARFSTRDDDGLIPGDNHKSVGMPAVALGVIAIGSFATRSQWVDTDGNTVNHIETTVDEISFFSSLGPSADPERTGPKPFIAAPGEYIVAALSRSSAVMEQGTKFDDGHVAMRGTSMSCPHAAGIAALLLQVDPTLDPDGIRSILAKSARSDDNTGTDLPNPAWDHGKIDAYEAVALAMGVGLCSDDADCTEGWVCPDAGRCEEKSDSGCGCGRTNPAPGSILLVLSILLLLGIRISASSRTGW